MTPFASETDRFSRREASIHRIWEFFTPTASSHDPPFRLKIALLRRLFAGGKCVRVKELVGITLLDFKCGKIYSSIDELKLKLQVESFSFQSPVGTE